MKVMTLNLAGLKYNWAEKRRHHLLQALGGLAPHFLCVQECSFVEGKTDYSQIADLASSLKIPFFAFSPYGNKRDHSGSVQSGIGIISAFPFSSVETLMLPPGEEEHEGERIVMKSIIEAEGKQFQVLTTHLAWRKNEVSYRKEQVRKIINIIDPHLPVIIAGDFNTTPDDQSLELIFKKYCDSFTTANPGAPGYTWDTANENVLWKESGNRRIDYIFCSQDFRVKRSEILVSKPDEGYSDHYALFSELEL